jgi:hypothetical protein
LEYWDLTDEQIARLENKVDAQAEEINGLKNELAERDSLDVEVVG